MNGNSHLNVIHAQALIIWEKSVVWQLWLGLRLCPTPRRAQLTLRKEGEREKEGNIKRRQEKSWAEWTRKALMAPARRGGSHRGAKMPRTKKPSESVIVVCNNGEGGVNVGVRLCNVLLLSKARGLQEGFKEPQQHHKAPGERGLPSRGQGREGEQGEGQTGWSGYSDQDPFPAWALEFLCSCHRSPFPPRLNPSLPHAQ